MNRIFSGNTKLILSDLFGSAFDFSKWSHFLKKYIHINLSKNDIQEVFEENLIDKTYYFGPHKLSDNNSLGIFYIRTNNQSQITRRVRIKRFINNICSIEHNAKFNAALIVIDSGNQWQLSFLDNFTDKNVSVKCSSYIFGIKNSCLSVPIKRFNSLYNKSITLDLIRSIFSTDTLFKEFTSEFKNLYKTHIKNIVDMNVIELMNSEQNRIISNISLFNNKTICEYIKLTMIRITILYFLRKKGWLNDLYDTLQIPTKSEDYNNFLDTVLKPLFFGILNTDYPYRNSIFADKRWDTSLLSEWRNIPYLNINIFEQVFLDKLKIKLPNSFFQNIFNLFENYNFVIDENQPNDKEIGIDSEIIGTIFECLLENNKDKGVFYTPKEIVRYMCQESIISFLEVKTSILPKKLRYFVLFSHTTQAANKVLSLEERKQIEESLHDIKICDPSVGSGAFLIGMLDVLADCYENLNEKHFKRSDIKKYIIKNNIYGVDIDKDAVNITRLRLCLSIIADEENPIPLPNLDYKIMQGNSLVESYQGLNFNNIIENNYIGDLQLKLSDLLSEYYDCYEYDKKISIRNSIKNQVFNLFDLYKLDLEKIQYLKEVDISGNNMFFLWHIWFSDILSLSKNEGFDIIITNPPYIGEKGHKNIFKDVKADNQLGKYYIGKMDYFYFFFHLAINLLSPNGIGTLITTNYFLTASGAKKLRDDIKRRTNINLLFNFGEFQLFYNATGQHNIICSFSKTSNSKDCRIIDYHKKSPFDSKVFHSIIFGNNDDTYYLEIKQCDLYEGKNNYIRIQNNNEDIISVILNKICSDNKQLGKIAEINTGIMGGCDKISKYNYSYLDLHYIADNDICENDGIFILESKNERDKIKIDRLHHYPFLKNFFKNSDIHKYYTAETSSKRLIFSSFDTKSEYQDIIQSHLSLYKPILTKIREINHEDTNKWYILRRGTAHPYIFTGQKIVCPQRCRYNKFGYNDCEWYASADVYYITNVNIDYNIKYLLGLLNSKLYYIWFCHKGKRKGETLELYQKPLSETPIKFTSPNIQNKIVNLVNQILHLKKTDNSIDTSSLENEIDNIIFKIFKLTEQEIMAINKFCLKLKQ